MRYFVFLFICFFSGAGFCALDEEVILSADGTCALHYLTTQTKQNWTIELQEGKCENGFVEGYAEVKILSPTKKISEILSGFFIKGYWLGNFMGKGTFLTRTTPAENQQALSYLLDTKDNIQYVVQLRSVSQKGRAYGPFMGCPDFRILAVMENMDLFHEEIIRQKIKKQVLKYAHSLCPELETVAVFGANKVDAISSDIVFHMQINPSDEEEQVLILPPMIESKKFVNYPKNEVKNKEKIVPLAHLDLLSRLQNKSQKGRVILHVKKLNLDGTALVDEPQTVILKNYPDLKLGWCVAEGDYFNSEMSVSKIITCSKEWCSDVS